VREIRSSDAIANQIRMRRSIFEGAFLLLEGSSDKFLYGRFTDEVACELVVSSGKTWAIEVLVILEKSNFIGVLAIVDADFDRLESLLHQSSNLLRTDTHDLETMLIKSPALDKVLSIFGSEDKIKKFEKDVRTILLEAGLFVGYFLWLSKSDNLNLTFDGIKFKEFIDDRTLQLNELKLINEVKNKSKPEIKPLLSNTADIQQRIAAKKNDSHDPWQVCRGHDLVEILSIRLRKALGSNKASDVEPRSDDRKNTLESQLMLAYEAVYFYQTQLYQDILDWESNNQPFKVLKISQ
jgi:hypothetical protein